MPMVRTVKSRQRVIDHGEVFTPPKLVNDMLDLVANECERQLSDGGFGRFGRISFVSARKSVFEIAT